MSKSCTEFSKPRFLDFPILKSRFAWPQLLSTQFRTFLALLPHFRRPASLTESAIPHITIREKKLCRKMWFTITRNKEPHAHGAANLGFEMLHYAPPGVLIGKSFEMYTAQWECTLIAAVKSPPPSRVHLWLMPPIIIHGVSGVWLWELNCNWSKA